MSKRVKFGGDILVRKWHTKCRMAGVGHSNKIAKIKTNNIFSLRSLEYSIITAQQIEAGRRLIRRRVKKGGQVLSCIAAFFARTGKPAGVRMGNGKGGRHRDRIAFLRPGKVLYEIRGINSQLAKKALLAAAYKFNFAVRVTSINDF